MQRNSPGVSMRRRASSVTSRYGGTLFEIIHDVVVDIEDKRDET